MDSDIQQFVRSSAVILGTYCARDANEAWRRWSQRLRWGNGRAAAINWQFARECEAKAEGYFAQAERGY